LKRTDAPWVLAAVEPLPYYQFLAHSAAVCFLSAAQASTALAGVAAAVVLLAFEAFEALAANLLQPPAHQSISPILHPEVAVAGAVPVF